MHVSYQSQLWISAGIHPKLKVASPQTQHGTSLPSQDGGGEQGVGQAGAWGNGHQMGTCTLLSIQSVYEGSQLLCVHLLEEADRHTRIIIIIISPQGLILQPFCKFGP